MNLIEIMFMKHYGTIYIERVLTAIKTQLIVNAGGCVSRLRDEKTCSLFPTAEQKFSLNYFRVLNRVIKLRNDTSL